MIIENCEVIHGQVIHLVRDPRAILNSRKRKGWSNNSPRSKCQMMETDLGNTLESK